jgi:PAS domain S-box-containing protein
MAERLEAASEGVAEASAQDEGRFRALADAAAVMVWRSGPDKRLDYANRHWLEFTGRDLDQELGLGWTRGIHPEDYQRTLDIFHAAHAAHLPFTMDLQLRRHDGEYRWLLCNGVPFSRRGAFAGLLGCCVDISAHRDELSGSDPLPREAVLRQLNHRVKNSLQTSISFSALGREFGDPSTLDELSDMTERLALLSLAHEQLARLDAGSTAAFADYLQGVAEAVHRAIGKPNVALSVRCEPVGVSPKHATTLGTIVDELMTIALTSQIGRAHV